MSSCNTCFKELIPEFNWYKSSIEKSEFICKRCRSIVSTKYRKEYYQNNKNQITIKNMLYRIKQRIKLTEEVN